MTGIYKITNMINGMSYIGQSIDIERRWKEHKRNIKTKNTKLYQAFREYGIENFSFEVLEECTTEELNEKEKYYMKQYNTLEEGYNMSIIENQQNKIDWEIAKQIIAGLRQPNLTGSAIAEKYGVSHSLISQINQGRMWNFENEKYPIRKVQQHQKKGKKVKRKTRIKKNKKVNLKKSRKQQLLKGAKLRPPKPKWQCPLSREQLKEAIRTKPFTQIGKENGVTDNAIRKWCDKYNLPRHKREIEKYTDEEWLLI